MDNYFSTIDKKWVSVSLGITKKFKHNIFSHNSAIHQKCHEILSETLKTFWDIAKWRQKALNLTLLPRDYHKSWDFILDVALDTPLSYPNFGWPAVVFSTCSLFYWENCMTISKLLEKFSGSLEMQNFLI